MDVVNLLFFVYILVGVPVFGAWVVLFNRRFVVGSLEFQKRMFKWGYTETNVKVGRVIAVVAGAFLFIGGLMNAAKYLLP